jgi:uncharacterized protein (DUF2236 family)
MTTTPGVDRSAAGALADVLAGRLRRQMFGETAKSASYLEPKGDPGFFGPDSITWRVHANPIALAVGGVAAVILELAEPRVRTGVWEHSIFARDPLTRLRRTGEATMITTFGPTAAAQARVDMVTRMHQRVTGTTPEGQAYVAMDPELLGWVHLTAGYGFLNAYRRYADPHLSLADQDRYYAEAVPMGRAFGAPDPSRSAAEAEAGLRAMAPRLVPHPIIGEFLEIIARTSPFGAPGRLLQPLVVEASIDLLPAWVRDQLGLSQTPARLAMARPLLRSLGMAAQMAPGDIPRQAYARMGRRPPRL